MSGEKRRKITMTSRFSVFLSGFEPVTSRIQAKKRYTLIHIALHLWFPPKFELSGINYIDIILS
jgi:hypothetical protein